MPDAYYLGFDFGYKRIGVAIGQNITYHANPLDTIAAKQGIPNWDAIQKLIQFWNPKALIVGLPTCIDGASLYTTQAARTFARRLKEKFGLPVHLVDERLSTVEARAQLFAEGGYRKIQKSQIDGRAACIILEQWLHKQEES